MTDVRSAAVPLIEPAPVAITISPTTFHEIEDLRRKVDVNLRVLNDANEEKKAAQKAYDASRDTLEKAVSRMIREINGEPEFPLFANQSDAITSAEADPIAQKLLGRLIDHGVSHLNQLVVAGYNEDERNQLARYLDALDARKVAESEGAAELPELIEMPAFLVADEAPDAATIADLVTRCSEQGLVVSPAQCAIWTTAQATEITAWLDATAAVKLEKGDAVTMDDLSPAPAFLVAPIEASEESAENDQQKSEKKPRAPRKPSGAFKTSPRVAKAKKAKKV